MFCLYVKNNYICGKYIIMNIPLHTIVFTIGPSNAGKSHLIENVLLPQIRKDYKNLNVHHISSDDIRRELLGDDHIDKNDTSMLYVSSQAFKMLFNKLEMLLSYPIKSELIFVDTMGLDEKFRSTIKDLANKYHYNTVGIIFDYKDYDDYFKYKYDETRTTLISNQLRKLRKDVLRNIKREKHTNVFKLNTNDFKDVRIDIDNYDFYRSHFINTDKECVVVSDLHGCLKEFKELILNSKCEIDQDDNIIGDKIFIVQDYVDKGYDVLGIVRFIHKNVLNGSILPLIGNHENYVYKRLTGVLNEAEHDKYFDSIQLFNDNEDEKELFIDLFENYSKHFYQNKNFFANHAPCELKYLGKVDDLSLRKQRNFVYPKYDDNLSEDENITIIEDSIKNLVRPNSDFNSLNIVWGHISMKNWKKFEYIFMIDTGCVGGNKLTGIAFNNIGSYFIKNVNSSIENKENLLDLFKNKKVDIEFENLEFDDKKRISFMLKNKINYISGTIAPSDKNMEDNILEDIRKGLDYYKQKGINKVILEPKYMGSRCNIYLHKNIDDTYCVSRNGYLINVDYKEALKPLYEIPFIKEEFENKNAKVILLDSELLPWSAIGKGLINKDFLSVKTGINTEYEILKESGFDEMYNELISQPELMEFKKEINNMKKADIVDKYGYRVYETYKNVNNYMDKHISIDEIGEYVNKYNRQIELFGSDKELEFKPFNILKIVYEDYEQTFFDKSNIDIFEAISSDDYCVVDFESEDCYEKADEYWKRITEDEEMEGVVIKPEIVYNKNIAPYIKCRNENYLTIIYGYDYLKSTKYKKLINRKRITKKLKSSILEFELGKKMLEVPYNDINKDNDKLISLYIKMIIDEKEVEKLDPRL